MSLNKEKKAFLYTVFFEKFAANMEDSKGKTLTKEEKKAIYKKNNKVAQEKLSKKFSKEEIKEINKYQLESNKVNSKSTYKKN